MSGLAYLSFFSAAPIYLYKINGSLPFGQNRSFCSDMRPEPKVLALNFVCLSVVIRTKITEHAAPDRVLMESHQRVNFSHTWLGRQNGDDVCILKLI